MLKKDFEYIEKLNKLEKGKFKGSVNDIAYFGLNKNSSYKQRQSVRVLFYNSRNDFAVQLKSKQNDVISLYRTNDDKTLNEYFNDLNKKTMSFVSYLGDNDLFKAPVLDFISLREFNELCDKQIKGTDIKIGRAIETIQFKMNEEGIKLKSEAAIATEYGGLPQYKITPRYLYFDDKFVIFISEEGKQPYFAMKVTDPAVLQK